MLLKIELLFFVLSGSTDRIPILNFDSSNLVRIKKVFVFVVQNGRLFSHGGRACAVRMVDWPVALAHRVAR